MIELRHTRRIFAARIITPFIVKYMSETVKKFFHHFKVIRQASEKSYHPITLSVLFYATVVINYWHIVERYFVIIGCIHINNVLE